MKRYYLILLALSLALLSCGCVREKTVSEESFSFYYLSDKIEFQQDDGFIGKEMRNVTGLDAAQMLELYLKGPQSQALVSPFPNGVTLVDFNSKGNNAVVKLSAEFAQLSEFRLASACACLTLTLCDFSGVSTVTIQAEDLPSQFRQKIPSWTENRQSPCKKIRFSWWILWKPPPTPRSIRS